MHMPFESLEHIAIDGLTLEGMLVVPAKAQGLVLFAHGSGSSRHSPRNNFVVLQYAGHGADGPAHTRRGPAPAGTL